MEPLNTNTNPSYITMDNRKFNSFVEAIAKLPKHIIEKEIKAHKSSWNTEQIQQVKTAVKSTNKLMTAELEELFKFIVLDKMK